MALFKTSIQDIQKYKSEKNTKKLIKCLADKEKNVSRSSLEALLELNQVDSRKDMVAALIKNNNSELNEVFFNFIRKDKDNFITFVIEYIVNRLEKLNEKHDIKKLLKSIKILNFISFTKKWEFC